MRQSFHYSVVTTQNFSDRSFTLEKSKLVFIHYFILLKIGDVLFSILIHVSPNDVTLSQCPIATALISSEAGRHRTDPKSGSGCRVSESACRHMILEVRIMRLMQQLDDFTRFYRVTDTK